MGSETNERDAVDAAQSLQEDSDNPKKSIQDQRETDGASISQPVALMLAQSIEAGTSVLPAANGSDLTGKGAQDREEEEEEDDYVTGIRLILALFALILGVTLIFLDNSILSTVRTPPDKASTHTRAH